MLLILLVVFLAVFAIMMLILLALRGDSASHEKLRATLAAALSLSRLAGQEEVIDVRKHASLSSVPWIHHLLTNLDAAGEMQNLLDQADVKWTPGRLLLTSALFWVLAAAVILFRLNAGFLSLLFGMPFGVLPFVWVWRVRAKRFRDFESAMPNALDLMVSALRAGHSLIGALGTVATDAPEPIRREFRLCFEEQNFGMDLRLAMANLLHRVPLPDLHICVTAIMIHKESGGNLAESLEQTGQIIRGRFRLRDQMRVQTAQGRATGAILTIMPLVLGIVLYVANPRYINVLLTHPLGHKMMAFGAVMNLLGLLLIQRIVRVRR